MNDTNDEIVGRVLQGLRDAAPPDGMESRVVSAIRHRAASMPIPARTPLRVASFGGAAVLASALCALFFTAHRKPLQAALPLSSAISLQARNESGMPAKPATLKLPKPMVRRVRLATASPSQKEELAAISYPAPPMPLTDQEKLLLRIIHQGDPIQIAMLDPVQRDARYAAEHAEFTKFFEPSAKKTQ